jgi:hypothetical protein
MTAVPRDLTQPLQALARANEVKAGWTQYRRDLMAMQSVDAAAEVADMLDTVGLGLESDATVYAGPIAVAKVVGAIRHMGAARYRRTAFKAGLRGLTDQPWLRVRDLKPHEAFALADGLRRLHPALSAEACPAPRAGGLVSEGFDVDAAVDAWREGEPARVIAERMGCSPPTVLRIVHAFEARETDAIRRTTTTALRGEA